MSSLTTPWSSIAYFDWWGVYFQAEDIIGQAFSVASEQLLGNFAL
jgi:hypothetical protein